MRAVLPALALVCAVIGAPVSALAHGVHPHVETQAAVTVIFSYEDHAPMAGERFEVMAPDGETVFTSGVTDLLGRAVFRPNQEGTWTVRVFSENGHGATARVPVGGDLLAMEAAGPRAGKLNKVITGVAVLFGIFGIAALVFSQKK
nr:hypothetical protein [Candidatus Krumholzibacteria bacterium]